MDSQIIQAVTEERDKFIEDFSGNLVSASIRNIVEKALPLEKNEEPICQSDNFKQGIKLISDKVAQSYLGSDNRNSGYMSGGNFFDSMVACMNEHVAMEADYRMQKLIDKLALESIDLRNVNWRAYIAKSIQSPAAKFTNKDIKDRLLTNLRNVISVEEAGIIEDVKNEVKSSVEESEAKSELIEETVKEIADVKKELNPEEDEDLNEPAKEPGEEPQGGEEGEVPEGEDALPPEEPTEEVAGEGSDVQDGTIEQPQQENVQLEEPKDAEQVATEAIPVLPRLLKSMKPVKMLDLSCEYFKALGDIKKAANLRFDMLELAMSTESNEPEIKKELQKKLNDLKTISNEAFNYSKEIEGAFVKLGLTQNGIFRKDYIALENARNIIGRFVKHTIPVGAIYSQEHIFGQTKNDKIRIDENLRILKSNKSKITSIFIKAQQKIKNKLINDPKIKHEIENNNFKITFNREDDYKEYCDEVFSNFIYKITKTRLGFTKKYIDIPIFTAHGMKMGKYVGATLLSLIPVLGIAGIIMVYTDKRVRNSKDAWNKSNEVCKGTQIQIVQFFDCDEDERDDNVKWKLALRLNVNFNPLNKDFQREVNTVENVLAFSTEGLTPIQYAWNLLQFKREIREGWYRFDTTRTIEKLNAMESAFYERLIDVKDPKVKEAASAVMKLQDVKVEKLITTDFVKDHKIQVNELNVSEVRNVNEEVYKRVSERMKETWGRDLSDEENQIIRATTNGLDATEIMPTPYEKFMIKFGTGEITKSAESGGVGLEITDKMRSKVRLRSKVYSTIWATMRRCGLIDKDDPAEFDKFLQAW